MAEFDIIEIGFENEDETLNFGSRTVGDDNLYEISTIACLKQSEDKKQCDINVKAETKNDRIILSINNSLKVFEDIGKIIFNAQFETDIASFGSCENGRYIAVCFSSGLVNILDVEQPSSPIFSEQLVESGYADEISYVKCIPEECSAKLLRFFVILSPSKIYRITIAIELEEEKVHYNCSSEMLIDLNLSDIVATVFVLPFLAVSGTEFCIYNVRTKTALSDNLGNFKNIVPFGHYFISLDAKGTLSKICMRTLMLFHVDYEHLIDQLITIGEHHQKKQILLCTKKDEQGNSFLQLLNADFTRLFSLKMSNMVYLAQTQRTTDDVMLLSAIGNTENVVLELRIQRVYETEPKLRIMRLIRKQQFQEAEKIAQIFNEDPVAILKAKANIIVEKLKCDSQDIINLINLLDSIKDDKFNLLTCLEVNCSRLEDVRKILMYGIRINSKPDDTKHIRKLLTDRLFRFDTYMALSDDADKPSWDTFLSINLIEAIKSFLENYNMEDAIITYNRLDNQTVMTLSIENLEEILQILNNLPENLSQRFLSTFIPMSIKYKPTGLHIFVKWLYDRILQLEQADKNDFPENGILLSESVLNLIKVDNNSFLSFQRLRALNKDGIDELANLMEGLRTLEKLKNRHYLNVPLKEYLKGPNAFVAYLLHIFLPPDQYERFLKEFLYNYLIQNEFDPDIVFSQRITELFYCDDVCLIEILMKFISRVETKLLTVKELLNKMSVPWNDVVKTIAKTSLHEFHPLATQIKDMLDSEQALIVLSNPKYKAKCEKITDDVELRRIIERIIYVNEPDFLRDIFDLCQSSKERNLAMEIIFQRFVLKGNADKVFSILDKCNKEELYATAKFNLIYATEIINNKYMDAKIKDAFYQTVYPLYRKLSTVLDDEIEKDSTQQRCNNVRAVYKINKIYGLKLTTHEFQITSRKMEIFDEIIANNISVKDCDLHPITQILNVSGKLALYFMLDKDDVLLKICDQIGDLRIILEVANHLYENGATSKKLCQILVLFLKYLPTQDTHQNGTIFGDDSLVLGDPTQTEEVQHLCLQGFELGEKVIAKALVSLEEDDDRALIHHVMKWINTGFYFTRRKDTPTKEALYRNIYLGGSFIPSFKTFATIKRAFDISRSLASSMKVPHSFEYLVSYCFNSDIETNLTEDQLFQQFSTLFSDITELCKEGQHFTACKLLKTIAATLSISSPNNAKVWMESINNVIIKKCTPALIHAVTSANYIDISLLYDLLLMSGKDYLKYVHHYMKMYKRQHKKLHDLAVTGIMLLDYHKETQGREPLLNNAMICKWWKKLQNVMDKLQYESFFRANGAARLSQLIASDLINVAMVKEYCDDFKIDSQSSYKKYLNSCLLNWKPTYEYKTDQYGCANILLNNKEEELQSKVLEAISYISDQQEAMTILEKCLPLVNFYHYEVFICIYNILKKHSAASNVKKTNLLLLSFLRDYKRYSPPSQREKEEWYTAFPDSQMLDPISEYRLPFTQLLFTSDLWSIIRPEINLKTYRRWFNATNVLEHLNKDDICVYAIKQVVSSGILGDNMCEDWILYPKLQGLIKDIGECARNISDLERATSAIYHLMSYTPNGADKVHAAQLSFSYATLYREKYPKSPDVEKAYIKVKNKYYGFSAKHILYKFNLADEKYLQLVSHPECLVESLYLDERILEYTDSVNLCCPDINAAVVEISNLFQLNLEKIRHNLFISWLTSSDADTDLDSSFFDPLKIVKSANNAGEFDSNLKRAIYLCSSCDSEFWVKQLITIGLNEAHVDSSEQNSALFKSRALRCLCAITNEDTIVTLTNLTYKEFLNYVDKLSLLSQLECLGMHFDIETLDMDNKRNLLNRLSQTNNRLATKVMGSISMTYLMDGDKSWEFIINNSIKLGMVNELKEYINFLKNKCDKNYYKRAWQTIVDHAFLQNVNEDTNLDELYINNFLMIQSCPVLFSLDFEFIFQQCIKMGKLEFAAVLLQYLSDENKQKYVKVVLKSKDILLRLEELNKKGIWGVQNVKKWLGKLSNSS